MTAGNGFVVPGSSGSVAGQQRLVGDVENVVRSRHPDTDGAIELVKHDQGRSRHGQHQPGEAVDQVVRNLCPDPEALEGTEHPLDVAITDEDVLLSVEVDEVGRIVAGAGRDADVFLTERLDDDLDLGSSSFALLLFVQRRLRLAVFGVAHALSDPDPSWWAVRSLPYR